MNRKEYAKERVTRLKEDNVLTVTNDRTFIQNLFLMSRTKKHEFKCFIKTLKSASTNKLIQFVKVYGISEDLMNQLINVAMKNIDFNTSVKEFEEFIIKLYEENKQK